MRDAFSSLDIVGFDDGSFSAILVEIKEFQAIYIADKIRRELKRTRFYDKKGDELPLSLTCTVGVAEATREFDRASHLQKRVDELTTPDKEVDKIYYQFSGKTRSYQPAPLIMDDLDNLELFD